MAAVVREASMLGKCAVTVAVAASVFAVPVATVAPAMASTPTARGSAATATVAHRTNLPVSGPGTATFTLIRFVHRGGWTYANGVVRVVNAKTHQVATRNVSMALRPSRTNGTVHAPAATGTCTILDLTLGPLHLDLLGLVIDLNQVHLVITAQQGPGNLLGNLLCALANLLNPRGSGLAVDLNRLLAA
jgi:hypothetical protein